MWNIYFVVVTGYEWLIMVRIERAGILVSQFYYDVNMYIFLSIAVSPCHVCFDEGVSSKFSYN